jgi:uracil-DNA glycosylase family 4
MAEPERPDAASLAKQCRQYLDSFKAAGVEWLPAPGPVPAGYGAPPAELPLSRPVSSIPSVPAAPPRPGSMTPQTGGGSAMLPFEQASALIPLEARRQALAVLSASIKNCPRCAELMATRTQTVFGVGKIDAELCFIGEAPGADEDAQGEPFVGAAGQLLNKIIASCGLKREEVYICNILKCRPPGNRTPLPNEAANCREYLDQQLELVRPRFICALGACAAQNLLGTTQSIGRLRGSMQNYKGIPVWCTYHPAYLLRSPDKKRDVWEDMKKLLVLMGRTVPRS